MVRTSELLFLVVVSIMEDMMRLDGILDHLLSFHWNVTLMLDIQCQALLNRMGLQKEGIAHCWIW